MDQLVYNCMLYNPAGTMVRELGSKVEQRWLDNWRRNPVLAPYAVPVRGSGDPLAGLGWGGVGWDGVGWGGPARLLPLKGEAGKGCTTCCFAFL